MRMSFVGGSASGHTRLLASCVALLAVLMVTGCPVPPPVPGGPTTFPSAPAPGLNVTYNQVVIPADLRPEVTFTATDDAGNIIPLAEFGDVRFILDYLQPTPTDGSTPSFVSYTTTTEDPDKVPNSGDEATQATYDSARLNGLTQNADGSLTYKFAKALPADYNQALTHQLAAQITRNDAVNGETYPVNAIDTFRPDGGTVTEVRDIVNTETCNNCHTRLGVHGGDRREVQLCIMCHTPQTTDANSGNTVSFPVMIHKIHMGEGLPSVQDGHPYQIIGYRDSVNDYSDVVFPQDVRNCQACHAPNDAKVGYDVYLNQPTLAGCASCHDRTWFGDPNQTPAEYTNHPGGQQVNDTLCSLCHTPTAPGVSPITEAHVLPSESADAPGLTLTITNVDTAPVEGGTSLTITFTAVDKNGDPYTSLSPLDTVASTFAYPVSDYETSVRETIQASFGSPPGVLVSHGDGSYDYTFGALLPTPAKAQAGMTFAVAMEGRIKYTFRGVSEEQGTSTNSITYFTLDGSEPQLRRAIADEQKCDVCHREVRMHGELRVGVDYCVMCHNVNATDEERRPADKMPPATIDFKEMIHRIHTGENLEMPYTVYGYGNTPHDFTEVAFPGLRQDCAICHVSGSTDVPLPASALPTTITENGELVSTELATSAACTSCHDALVNNVHAALATDMQQGIESCAVCHGNDADFAVQTVHALAP